MVFILIAGFTGPIHYRILLEPSSSMNSQQVSTSPCSIVWLLNAVLQLRALIFYQTCCSGHNFPSCHSSLSLHGTECLTCKGFANVMMMQFAIADHVATHACTYMPQPITILVQSAVWLQITGRTSCTHTAQHKLWVMASWAPLAYPPTTTGAGLPLASALPTSCYSMSSLSSCSPSCHVSLCSPLPCQWLCSEC